MSYKPKLPIEIKCNGWINSNKAVIKGGFLTNKRDFNPRKYTLYYITTDHYD